MRKLISLSDQDLGAIIAYLKTVPPVDHKTNGHQFTLMAKVMLAAGMLGKLPVEVVSHDTNVAATKAGVSAEYGKYLVNINERRTCHGHELACGPFPAPTIKVISPNITSGSEIGFWTEVEFVNTIRTDVASSGHEMNSELMPWKDFSLMYDDELRAIFMYLQSIPKLEQATK
jgi:hypothetical protein